MIEKYLTASRKSKGEKVAKQTASRDKELGRLVLNTAFLLGNEVLCFGKQN